MQLEGRTNPSVPGGLLAVPLLQLGGINIPDGTGYQETHTITRLFSHTITLDESGSGTDGEFTLDIVGDTHSDDVANGSGGPILTATGHLTTDITYHTVVHGQYSPLGFTIDHESYVETGSETETHVTQWDPAEAPDFRFDDTYTSNWTLSWEGSVTGGLLTFSSFTYSASWQLDWNYHFALSSQMYQDSHVGTGANVDETGGGAQASYSGATWYESHDHSHFPYPPYDDYSDESWNHPDSGAVPLDRTPLTPPVTWKAEEPTAVNFSWHGQSSLTGTLAETATRHDMYRLEVNSFQTTSHDSDTGHLIEDEPGVPDSGSGQENYHKDETFAGANDTTGGGSYVNNTYSADFHVTESSSVGAHDVLTVTNDQSSGLDDDGLPFEMTSSYTTDRTTSGTYTNDFNYHDGNDGPRLLDSTYSSDDNGTLDFHIWGVRNGAAFDNTDHQYESGGPAFGIPGDNVPIDSPVLYQAYPYTTPDSSGFLVAYGGPDRPPPANTLGQLQGGIGRLPQTYYNARIQQIGEDAKKKVANLSAQRLVMLEVNTTQRLTGTFVINTPGTWSQAVGKGKEYDKAVAAAEKNAKGRGWTGITVTPDVEMTYYVEPAPPGVNRSGKCVVEYKIRIKMNGTFNGRPVSETHSNVVGNLWFNDDNLKTMRLR
jgi:hypothetical protein